MFGVGSARWPDCPSNSEVAHGVGPIPVSVAGGVEQKEEKSGLPRVTMRAEDILNLSLEPTACMCMRKDVLPDYLVQNSRKTDKTEKNVCAARCSVYIVAMAEFLIIFRTHQICLS